MAKHIIDRRQNPKGKNLSNRQRFIRRYKDQIKKSIEENIKDRSVKDLKSGEKVKIPSKNVSEPRFRYDTKTGSKNYILPGNQDYIEGDKIRKPPRSAGSGQIEASDEGVSEDDFIFYVSKDEFLDLLFDDLQLPNLKKKKKANIENFVTRRAGYVNEGAPNNLNLEQSMIKSVGRRIALKTPKDKEIKELEEEIERLEKEIQYYAPKVKPLTKNRATIAELQEKIVNLKMRRRAVPFIDPIDLKFNNYVKIPNPINSAVMFCILDVSASMGQREKDLAKRFFILLHLFLTMKYDKVDIIFIRHHTWAVECNEEEFFSGRESGGTMVSTALDMANDIIRKRYDLEAWNIYISQCSDGDNFSSDNLAVETTMREKLLPIIQYFAYVNIVNSPSKVDEKLDGTAGSGLEKLYYALMQKYDNMKLQRVYEQKNIYPVFRAFFEKEQKNG